MITTWWDLSSGWWRKNEIKLGDNVKIGDAIIGLPSSGLHTNGYSLVRKIFGTDPKVLEYRSTRSWAGLWAKPCWSLTAVTISQLKPLLPSIKGLAHITGGSFYKNIPRVLPEGLAAQIDRQVLGGAAPFPHYPESRQCG